MISLRQAYYHRPVVLNADGSEQVTEQTTSGFGLPTTRSKALEFMVHRGSDGQEFELETFSEMSGF